MGKMRNIADIVRHSRIRSKALHGRVGQGRKTKFTDRKKEALKNACRGGATDER